MTPLFRKVDCLRLPVPDLDAALAFYRDALGHELIWRSDTTIGLRLPESEAEIVLTTEAAPPETDLLVEDATAAVARIVAAGGRVIAPTFEIAVGLCAVVADPFGNTLVVLDMTKGPLVTDDEGNVLPRSEQAG